MSETIEMGTISSKGQVAIPALIREEMGLEEGSKILFLVADDTLLIKKVTSETFSEITKPLKEAAKKAGFKEEDVVGLVHRARKKK
jgi:AbrB family looped-hinge helix DNA binding protein